MAKLQLKDAAVGHLSASQQAVVTAGQAGDVYLLRAREAWHLSRRELANLNAIAARADAIRGLDEPDDEGEAP